MTETERREREREREEGIRNVSIWEKGEEEGGEMFTHEILEEGEQSVLEKKEEEEETVRNHHHLGKRREERKRIFPLPSTFVRTYSRMGEGSRLRLTRKRKKKVFSPLLPPCLADRNPKWGAKAKATHTTYVGWE